MIIRLLSTAAGQPGIERRRVWLVPLEAQCLPGASVMVVRIARRRIWRLCTHDRRRNTFRFWVIDGGYVDLHNGWRVVPRAVELDAGGTAQRWLMEFQAPMSPPTWQRRGGGGDG